MVRRCASFGFWLAIVLVLGFALAQANAPKPASASIDFSMPWEPASPAAFQAAAECKITTVESGFQVEDTQAAAAIVVQLSLADSATTTIPPPALRTFAPLRHRPPPPANS